MTPEPGKMWLYGRALEQTGDAEGACSAYVLSRWGASVPRAVIAEKARALCRAPLSCGVRVSDGVVPFLLSGSER